LPEQYGQVDPMPGVHRPVDQRPQHRVALIEGICARLEAIGTARPQGHTYVQVSIPGQSRGNRVLADGEAVGFQDEAVAVTVHALQHAQQVGLAQGGLATGEAQPADPSPAGVGEQAGGDLFWGVELPAANWPPLPGRPSPPSAAATQGGCRVRSLPAGSRDNHSLS